MRTLKLCFVLGLVLAMAGAAGAVTVPSLCAPYTYIKMNDHVNGTLYAKGREDPGTFVWDDGENRWEPEGVNRAADLDIAPAQGAIGDEDTWGVLAWRVVRPGLPKINDNGTPADTSDDYVEGMSNDPTGTMTYNWTQAAGDPGTGLVGMFYGGKDVKVLIRADGSFQTWSEGLQIDLYAVDSTLLGFNWDGTSGSTGDFTIAADYEGPQWDPRPLNEGGEFGRRTSQNTYENWVDIDDATKVPLLHAVSEHFNADGSFDGTYFTGGSLGYLDIDDGGQAPGYWQWNDLVDDQGPGGTELFTDPEGDGADLWFDVDALGDQNYWWLSKSNDDGGFGAVPEPMTMLAVSFAAVGLAGYTRRRRRA